MFKLCQICALSMNTVYWLAHRKGANILYCSILKYKLKEDPENNMEQMITVQIISCWSINTKI